jgi:tellurite resistance protein
MNVSLAARASSRPARPSELIITPPLFAIPFGIAGLCNTWRIAGPQWTTVVGNVLAALSALLTVALAVASIARLVRRRSRLTDELRDPLLGPSVPALPIAAMLVSATLIDWDVTLAQTLVAIFAVLTLIAGIAVAGAWIVTRLPLRDYHAGFYLPTAGGALLAAQCVIGLDWVGFAQALFFVGLVSWLVLGLVSSLRLVRTPLPLALRPVLAIEIAAPALAGNTYLVIFHRFDGYAVALAAVTVVMGIVQIGLIPYYRQAQFGPAFWVSSFSYATAATLAMRWINQELPPGADWWRAVTLTLASGVVVLLSLATGRAIGRGQFIHRRTKQ